jgi:hypothetical protein
MKPPPKLVTVVTVGNSGDTFTVTRAIEILAE